MKSLMRRDLLILDDWGAGRNTSFGKERVFDVVDKRLLTDKPMIVAANLPLSVMKQAADLDGRRIFDRILEVCVLIRLKKIICKNSLRGKSLSVIIIPLQQALFFLRERSTQWAKT